jgi:hypothetical protein
MLSTRILLPIFVLVIVPSTAASAYDLRGEWPESRTKITKEEKRSAKGFFKHHKLAEARKSADQPAPTAANTDNNAAPTDVASQAQD